MLKTVKYYFSVAYGQLRLDSISNWMYKSYLLPWLIGIPLQAISGFFVLKAIMDLVGDIAGWGFPQVTFLFAMSQLSHGVDDLMFIQGRHIESMVIRGEFDRSLLRPLGVFFQFATAIFNWCGFFSIVPGIVLFFYACSLLQMAITPFLVLFVIVLTISGAFIRGSLLYLIGCIAFWTKKSSSLAAIDVVLKERTSRFPFTMYPVWFQGFFTFMIPLGFITFYPVSGLLNAPIGMHLPVPLDLLIWSPIAGALMFIAARAVFMYALKHKYESAGS